MQTGIGRRCLFLYSHRQRGISVVEMMVAVAVLAMIAVVATPNFSTANHQTLEMATQRVVKAIQFARSEAIRTGTAHGVLASTTDQHVRVYSWDGTSKGFTIYQPLTKQLYTLDFNANRALKTVSISQAKFNYDGVSGNHSDVLFAAGSGAPRYLSSANMLADGLISLQVGNEVNSVSVAPFTGRVTVQ